MKLFDIMDTAYDNFDNTIRIYLSKALTDIGQSFGDNQVFAIIFNGIKGVIQNVMLYIEDAFTEQNIETARRKKSIYSLAKLAGYDAFYGSAATGTLIGTMYLNNLSDTTTNKLYIKNYTVVKNNSTGISYLIILPTLTYMFDISKALVTHEFKIVQGSYSTATYTAIGEAFEVISVELTGLWDKNYITVEVNGVKYTEVGNIYDMTENSLNYVISVGYDNSFDVVFGNGSYGTLLNNGDNVTVRYIAHSGSNGNVPINSNASWSFVSSGYDNSGNTVDLNNYMSLSINNPITGGLDSDTVSTIRKMVGMTSKTGILISPDNFKVFLSRFSFIGPVNCWSESNSLEFTICALTNKYNDVSSASDYFDLDEDELLLNNDQKTMITETINNSNKTYAGLTVNFKDPIIRIFAIMCYVKVDTTYNKENVKSNISNAIATYFMKLGMESQFVSKSDIVQTVIESDENIKSFDFDFISKTAELCFYNGSYTKYETKNVNGTYEYIEKTVLYEEDTAPCLDNYGNIQLESNLEIPLLQGGFRYYPNKESNDKNTDVILDSIQYIFI